MNTSILQKAILHFGSARQRTKAIEELGELIVALSREGFRGTKDETISEIADAFIMLEQLKLIYGPESINAMIKFKLERLESMMIAEEIVRGRK